MIGWHDDVITSLARRRAVLFIGSGVSRNSTNAKGDRPPLWRDVLQKGIAKCKGSQREMTRLLNAGDLLSCCQLVKYKLGADWVPFLEGQFLKPDFKHHDIHTHIFGLDAPITLTPNFDKIYDNYAIATGGHRVRIKKYFENDIGRFLRGDERSRLIIKVHGCIDTPNELIFTREDYANARIKHEGFYRAIDALIMTNTFIFIGCGVGDPDISLLLEQYARTFVASPPHYFVTASKVSDDYAKMLKDNYNLICVTYSPKNEHEELSASLAELAESVEEKRAEMALEAIW